MEYVEINKKRLLFLIKEFGFTKKSFLNNENINNVYSKDNSIKKWCRDFCFYFFSIKKFDLKITRNKIISPLKCKIYKDAYEKGVIDAVVLIRKLKSNQRSKKLNDYFFRHTFK